MNKYLYLLRNMRRLFFLKGNYKVKVLIILVLLGIIFFTENNFFKSSKSSISSNISEQIVDDEFYEFRKNSYLTEHFQKHGLEMGYKNEKEYLERANQIIDNRHALNKKQDDQDTVFFLKSTGELVVLAKDGYIRTFFIPNDGISYYNRQ